MEHIRYKVVLVDDNMATLNQGKSLLQDIYKVYTLQSAELLFEYLENDIPDLILLDVEMPETDGFQTIEILKADKRYKDIPVIFLTSKSDEQSEHKGFALGAVDYIAKPFSGPLLQKRVSNQILLMRVQNAVKDYSSMIDEVAKANERARMLLEKMPFACLLWNKRCELLDCNEAAVSLFKFKNKQDCIDNIFYICPECQPDGSISAERYKELLKKAFNEGGFVCEWTHTLVDGAVMPAEVTFARIEYENNSVVATFTKDLREHELAVNEMRRAELAEIASLTKTQFLASMSHEFRTPMNSITGFAELALDSPEGTLPDKVKDYLIKIRDSSRWFLRIINDVLDISRIEAGKMELEQKPFDLKDVFNRCQSVVMPTTSEKGLDYRVYLEADEGTRFVGDPLRLYQVLYNLLSNAVKFTEKGFVCIRAKSVKTGENKARIHFEVSDTGIGITPEQAGRIFEPFTQADTGIRRTYGGTGLGLSISKSIIEQMGGALAVKSEPGEGSTFCFDIELETLPCTEDKHEITHKSGNKPSYKGFVLVCDDNPLNREVMCENLMRVGVKTAEAENGNECIQIIEKLAKDSARSFDLIFMDIFMPVMDGLEAAAKLKRMGITTPIIAVTANVMTDELRKYKEQGLKECLNKPFTPQELWKILDKYLELSDNAPQGEYTSDEEMLKHLEYNFVKSNANTYTDIVTALEQEDIKTAHRIAHTLKTTAGQINKPKLSEAAKTLEILLKNNTIPQNEDMLVLQAELNAVLQELELTVVKPEILPEPSSEQTKEIYKKLLPMLKERNTKCLELLSVLRAIPAAAELARQIEEFDFPLAEQTLEKLIYNQI